MPLDGRALIAVAGEDEAHRVLATALVDAVILERATGRWPERDEVDHARTYCGFAESSGFYRFQQLDSDLRERWPKKFFRVTRVEDQPAGEATWFITLYQLFSLRSAPPDVLVGLRDVDDKSLVAAADRARRYIETLEPKMVVVFGLPYRDAEAWFVAGLTSDRLDEARQELGFDPTAEPHRLTSQPNGAKTDAKRVLRFLLGEGESLAGAPSRAAPDLDSLAERTLGDLARLERAEATGLASFIEQLRKDVVSVVLPHLPSPARRGGPSR
ncbi:MAG: hypothetical protein ABMA64_20220 [Myxococcota bacterium]